MPTEAELWQQRQADRQRTLTRREAQLYDLLADGLSNREISVAMGISEGTVKLYLCRMGDKRGEHRRGKLIAQYWKARIEAL